MFTSIEIQNLALIAIGEEPIESINDNTRGASILKRIYKQTKQSELRKYNWNFAMARAKLPMLSEFSYDDLGRLRQYQIPTDCLRVVYIESWYLGAYYYNYIVDDDTQFRIEGNKIITSYNKNPLYIRYISDVDDTLLDPAFVDMLAYALAIKLSSLLTQTTTIKQQIIQLYQLALEDALHCNAIESAPTTTLDNSFITSRL